MKRVAGTAAVTGLALLVGAQVLGFGGKREAGAASLGPQALVASGPAAYAAGGDDVLVRLAKASVHGRSEARPVLDNEQFNEVIARTCAGCHSDTRRTGNLSLAGYDIAKATESPYVTEKMINKLRLDMMPPPGSRTPGADTLLVLTETLERIMDDHFARNPHPGYRPFQRLNRVEYAQSVRDLLGLEIDAGQWLPLDTRSANFDNIADVQMPSPQVLDAYLDAASEISRLAVGRREVSPTSATYPVARLVSQWEHVEGAPLGTRGGTSVIHNFPMDGEYTFRMLLANIPTGQLYGSTAPFDEFLEVSIDGERVALLEIDRFSSQSDPNGLNLFTDRIPVKAGPRRVSAAFLQTFDGPVPDLLAQIGHSINDTQIGSEHGITNVAHLRELAIGGPFNASGMSETPIRQRIFTCRPATEAQARPCAQRIVTELAGKAYRRPVNQEDVTPLMRFYDEGAAEGGFEEGVRMALEAILSSPHFFLRLETLPSGQRVAGSDQVHRLNDVELASRLSFFLWGTPPDQELIELARRGRLSNDRVLEQQARRMLADPRAEALGTRFAAQWLRLADLSLIIPDPLMFPDFHQQLVDDMRRETELFFHHLVQEDRSLLDFYTADFTWVNERLANHYGIPGVVGPQFRRVQHADGRRGILGHASVLTLTSMANRTSPVLRGKWVMEVLLGSPPPPPPPGVPDLEETEGAREGKVLTTRERLEMHRASPACRSCHMFMDPIGIALESYDVVGRWRIREGGMPVDSRGDFYDGTPITTPAELNYALLNRPIPMVRTFTENLMAYALGRRVEHFDQPTVRAITRAAEAKDYRMSEFVLGVIKSEPFRMKAVAPVLATEANDQ